MKIYEEKPFKSLVLIEEICDKCLKEIETEGMFDGFNFSLEHVFGNVFPEGSFTTTQSMELCKECAEELIDKLKGMGYRINQKDAD